MKVQSINLTNYQNQTSTSKTKSFVQMTKPMAKDTISFSGIQQSITKANADCLGAVIKALDGSLEKTLVYPTRFEVPTAFVSRDWFLPSEDILRVLNRKQFIENKVQKVLIYEEDSKEVSVITLEKPLTQRQLDMAEQIKMDAFNQVLVRKRKLRENEEDPYEGVKEFLNKEIRQIEDSSYQAIIQTLGVKLD